MYMPRSIRVVIGEGNGVLNHLGHLVELYEGGSWNCITCKHVEPWEAWPCGCEPNPQHEDLGECPYCNGGD